MEEKLITCNIADSILVEALLGAFHDEEGDTLAALINAVTRAAHSPVMSEDQRHQLEAEGGRLTRELCLIPARPIEA